MHTDAKADGRKSAVEFGWGAITYTFARSYLNIDSGIQNSIGGHTDTQTGRSHHPDYECMLISHSLRVASPTSHWQ